MGPGSRKPASWTSTTSGWSSDFDLKWGADLHESFERYERVLHRIEERDDGAVDRLFAFTRPLTGGYLWCPPQQNGRIVLGALSL